MPPKRANRFWKCLPCNGVANAKAFPEALAELPQASKWRKWLLRDSRKRQNGENGPCGTSASIKMGKMAFAELPQASKWGKWPLRNFRKRQNGENGVCGTSASVKMEKMTFAGLPQTPKSFSRDLRGSRKRQKVFRDTCGVPANAYPFFESMARNGTTKTAGYRRLAPTGTRPNLLADPIYSVGMSRLTFFEPTRA